MNTRILTGMALLGFCTLILFSSFAIALASISLDLNSNDQLSIKTTFINRDEEISQEFVYLVQVEDEQGYAVSLTFQTGTLLPGDEQEITMGWSPEDEGTYAIKSFVWNGFDHPIPLINLIHESIVTVNGEETAVCAGSATCFTGIVSKVVDGDTLDVGEIRIRLALVNTPELDEEGYDSAKEYTSTLCPVGSRILVDQDDGQLQDDFGRMLAKVTCSGTKNLNAELLYNGYAGILTQYCVESEFSIEDWARENGCANDVQEQIPASNRAPIADAGASQIVNEGATFMLDGRSSSDPDGDQLTYSWTQTSGTSVVLMNANTATPSLTAPSVDAPITLVFILIVSDGELSSTASLDVVVNDTPAATSPTSDEELNCDSSYPDVCIPPPPPDLDCGEISHRNFRVLQPDPHGFDGNNDGVGCES
jgi:endonuclease YncB( thermonuclease family)